MSQVHMNSAWTEVHMSQIDELDLSKFMILGSNGSWTVHGQPYRMLKTGLSHGPDQTLFLPLQICLLLSTK